MDIVNKRGTKGSQGNAASEYSDVVARAGSWQYGNDSKWNDVEAEKREQDNRWGVVNQTEDSDAAG